MTALHPKIFSGPITFLKSAPQLQFLPKPSMPEIAFAGRSNVGKSSLINALTNRNGLARTSNTPGRTQELNFFDVGTTDNGVQPIFRICDMPGYGFAKAPTKIVQKWRYLINDYLRGRAVLKRVFVLVDARHGIKPVDKEIFEMLDKAAVGYRIVLTKADKVKQEDLDAVAVKVMEMAKKHPAAHPDLIITSSEKKQGIDSLRRAVLEAVEA